MGFVISSNPSSSTLESLPHPSDYCRTNDEFLQENNLTLFRFPDRFLAGVLREVDHRELARLIRSFEDAQRSIPSFNKEHLLLDVDRASYRARQLHAAARKQWREIILFLNNTIPIYAGEIYEVKARIRIKANSL